MRTEEEIRDLRESLGPFHPEVAAVLDWMLGAPLDEAAIFGPGYTEEERDTGARIVGGTITGITVSPSGGSGQSKK